MKKNIKKLIPAAVGLLCLGSTQLHAAFPGLTGYFNALERQTMADSFDATKKVMPDRISLSLTEELRYNSNLYHAESGERDSMVLSSTLGMDISKTTSLYSYSISGLSIGYDYYFNDDRDETISAPTFNIEPEFLALQLAGDKLTLRVHGKASYSREKINNADLRYADHYTYGAGTVLDYKPNANYGVAFSGDWESEYYTKSEFKARDNNEFSVAAAPYWNVSPKTRLGLQLGRTWTVYNNDSQYNDSETNFANLFVNYRLAAKLHLTAAVGGEWVEYEGLSDGSTGSEEWLWNYSLALSYTPVANWTFNAFMNCTHDDSYAYDAVTNRGARGMTMSTEVGLDATWQVNRKLSVVQGVSATQNDEYNSNSDNTEYDYDITLNYALRDNVKLYLGYNYNVVNYKYSYGINRDFDSHEAKLGVTVTLR